MGRAAQAWLYLFSGSWVSSSTKPFTLYLQLFAVNVQKNTLSSSYSSHLCYGNYEVDYDDECVACDDDDDDDHIP